MIMAENAAKLAMPESTAGLWSDGSTGNTISVHLRSGDYVIMQRNFQTDQQHFPGFVGVSFAVDYENASTVLRVVCDDMFGGFFDRILPVGTLPALSTVKFCGFDNEFADYRNYLKLYIVSSFIDLPWWG